MARRLARQKPVEIEGSDDELPDLSTLLRGNTKKGTVQATKLDSTTISPRRISPRRRGPAITNEKRGEPAVSDGLSLNKGPSAINLSAATIALPPPISPTKPSPVKGSPVKLGARPKPEGPVLPVRRMAVVTEAGEIENGVAKSMQQQQRPLKLAHVNALLLPLSRVALGEEEVSEQLGREQGPSSRHYRDLGADGGVESQRSAAMTPSAIEEPQSRSGVAVSDVENGRERTTLRPRPKRAAKERANHLSRFILKEARCSDDSDGSSVDNDDDEEFTDLSGFIVDDDAELSVHGSQSEGSIDFDDEVETSKRKERTITRRLQRSRIEPRGRIESDDDDDDDNAAGKGNINVGKVAQELSALKLRASPNEERGSKPPEVIDLTYSPVQGQYDLKQKSIATTESKGVRPSPRKPSSLDVDPFVASEKDHLLEFSPPRFKSTVRVPLTAMTQDTAPEPTSPGQDDISHRTPPTTPPASPNKLKSPSKLHLLSPSKRGGGGVPVSPHRQSIDAFWSSDVINAWNDQYSPRKPPLTVSPNKRGPARLLNFDVWSDSDNEGANVSTTETASSSDAPTPTRGATPSSSSPTKAPKSPSKPSGRATNTSAESKKRFLSTRHTTAQSLLTYLDTHITAGRLSALSASTGGVKILWSKNLRSTAGRANWRRTVMKAASSPATDGLQAAPRIQHYASIELAEKVIDSDSRLANTLAHEFCHLANFMVSGVRDQPHGASFKAWADKVTTHLRTAPGLPSLYRAVEVTTKHSYVINHKYLWVCAGSAPVGPAQAAARAFLALDDDDDDDPGCGAEYGRHSKSIHPDRHRCGKCKGQLVQVRPKPKVARPESNAKAKSPRKGRRASPAKRQTGNNGGLDENKDGGRAGSKDNLDGLEQALEYVNLSD